MQRLDHHLVLVVATMMARNYSKSSRGSTTADDLLSLPDDGWHYELVHGTIVREPPPGAEHSWIGVNLAAALRAFVQQHRAGFVLGADCGFRIATDPDTVRAPDAAFVSADRLPDGLPRGYIPFAPELAAEIVSPGDRMSDVTRKTIEYLDAGTRIVWIIDPATRTVIVHRRGGEVTILREAYTLAGEDVLPGFSMPLTDLFDG